MFWYLPRSTPSDETRRKISEKLKGNKNGAGRRITQHFLDVVTDRWGDKNPNWLGDTASRDAGHARAERRFSIEGLMCNRCGINPAQVRHHKDENPLNNPEDGSNIEPLCRACHMKVHLYEGC